MRNNNELIVAENCVKNENNYFCNTKYNKARECVSDIIKTQNNTRCTYHEVKTLMFILKIRNSDITIIASNTNKTLKINCENFEKTNVLIGVHKFRTNSNCTLNNQPLDNTKYYNKELMFGNIDSELKIDQINNKMLELRLIHETEILVNELPPILMDIL